MNKLDEIFESAKILKIDDSSKFVIMSDCHRGAGDTDDNFVKNQNIFEGALNYYYDRGYHYIELGDGDEMWEVKNYKDIIEEHLGAFYILKKFYKEGRLIMIYGNHDMAKRRKEVLEKYFYKRYNKVLQKEEDILENIEVDEALVLDYKGYKLFLVHGHQVSFLNGTLPRFSRFLVRHVWRYLEKFGLKDPTSAAKNYRVTNQVERKLKEWSLENNKILIAGHTHRAIFPKVGQSLYFNDGSCIHPNGITCIEIEEGKITLVRWEYKIREDGGIRVGRTQLERRENISKFFK